MTANIWNTYEMVGAATTGVLIGGIPAIAIMMWKRWDGSVELAEAKQWWGKAMSVAAANDRARWAPHYSGNLNAEPHVTGEVLAIESVERCCTAHGDEPCSQDSGFVPPYCCGDCPDRMPALSDQSHEDEQAPAEDDDHAGAWWLPLMTVPLLLARVWGYLLEYCAEQVRLIRELASKPQPYRGRHWVVGTEHTSELPIIRRSSDNGETNAEAERIVFDAILQAHRQRTALVPAQRDGGVA